MSSWKLKLNFKFNVGIFVFCFKVLMCSSRLNTCYHGWQWIPWKWAKPFKHTHHWSSPGQLVGHPLQWCSKVIWCTYRLSAIKVLHDHCKCKIIIILNTTDELQVNFFICMKYYKKNWTQNIRFFMKGFYIFRYAI